MRTIDKPKIVMKLLTRYYAFLCLTCTCFLLLLVSYCYHNHIIINNNNNKNNNLFSASVGSIRGVKETKQQHDILETKLKHFDWQFYLKHNPDLIYSGIKTKERAIEHYSNYGFLEERWSNQAESPSSLACLRVKGMVNLQLELLQACEHYSKSSLPTKVLKLAAASSPSTPELVTPDTPVRSGAIPSAFVSSSRSADTSGTNGGLLTNVKSDDANESRSLIVAIGDFLTIFYHSIAELYSKSSDTLEMKLKHFDWQFYLKHNPDLIDSGINTEERAIEHYSNYGYFEERWSNEEDSPSMHACQIARDILSKSDWIKYCSDNR